jgi:hypothetical protein
VPRTFNNFMTSLGVLFHNTSLWAWSAQAEGFESENREMLKAVELVKGCAPLTPAEEGHRLCHPQRDCRAMVGRLAKKTCLRFWVTLSSDCY